MQCTTRKPPNHGLKKRALKKAATRAVVFLLIATQAKKIGPIVPRRRAGRPPDGQGLRRPAMRGPRLACGPECNRERDRILMRHIAPGHRETISPRGQSRQPI
jgi:hypothetical protein